MILTRLRHFGPQTTIRTLTEKEVLQHLEGKLKMPLSKEYMTQEIDNIEAVCNQTADRHPMEVCEDQAPCGGKK